MSTQERPTAQEVRRLLGQFEYVLGALEAYANLLEKGNPGDATRLNVLQEHDMAEALYKSTMLVIK
jgi:hypothetical protein